VSYCHHFSSIVHPSTFHILIFSSETTGPIATKLWWSFQQSLVEIGSVVSEEKIFFKFHPPFFSIFSLAATLVGSWDHRTQIWKGATQGSFHQSLVNWPSGF
jgi:hypothetical protein